MTQRLTASLASLPIKEMWSITLPLLTSIWTRFQTISWWFARVAVIPEGMNNQIYTFCSASHQILLTKTIKLLVCLGFTSSPTFYCSLAGNDLVQSWKRGKMIHSDTFWVLCFSLGGHFVCNDWLIHQELDGHG